MTQILVSDDVAESFAQAAAARGCTPGELASVVLDGWMRNQKLDLTPEQDAIIRARISTLDEEAMIPGEVIEAKFEALFQRLKAR